MNPGDSHFQMREKMFSIGDDSWIENGAGQDIALVLAVTVCIDRMTHD